MPKRRRLRSESGTQRYLGGPFKALSFKSKGHCQKSAVALKPAKGGLLY